MLVLADLESTRNDVCAALARLKQNAATKHLPVIAFREEAAADLQAAAASRRGHPGRERGRHINQLPQMLDQALHIGCACQPSANHQKQ